MSIIDGIRLLLTGLLLWGIYLETGPVTTITVLLIAIRLELDAYTD